MKNALIALGLLIIAFVFFSFLATKKPISLTTPPVDETVEKRLVEDYVRANIASVATDKPVLGGAWYVVSLNIDTTTQGGSVLYEDGHIQSQGSFGYSFDSTSRAVTIENFTVVQPTSGTTPIKSDDVVFCTQDAMQCSDGSYVSRTGTKCEFAACPGSSTKGTVSGRITLSPTCPVERNPPDPNCAPKGYQTDVLARKNGQVITTTKSNANGEYAFSLLAGTYEIEPVGGQALPRCVAQTVVIKSKVNTTLDLDCDTGIR